MSEEIPEPFLESSCYYLASVNSLEIKQHYKKKYPDMYCLSPTTVLELLDDEDNYSRLKHSVKRFTSHVKQTCQISSSSGYFLSVNDPENPVFPINDKKWDTYTNRTGVGESPDFLAYDSVHSIKVPLRTYENKSRQIPYYNRRQKDRKSSVSEVTQQMKGLVFERVEKTISFPVGCPNFDSASSSGKKNKDLKILGHSRKEAGNSARCSEA